MVKKRQRYLNPLHYAGVERVKTNLIVMDHIKRKKMSKSAKLRVKKLGSNLDKYNKSKHKYA